MPFQIGTDEAGYGPNLGPLTIAGTQWQTDIADVDLYHRLQDVVCKQRKSGSDRKLVIADSKVVHRGPNGFRNLELPVLALLTAVWGKLPNDWWQLMKALSPPEFADSVSQQVWMHGHDVELPVKADKREIIQLSNCFLAACEHQNTHLQRIRCVSIFPDQFNQELGLLGNKANLLSNRTLRIVKELLHCTTADVLIGCDKHGGRSKYAALIQEHLTDEFVIVGKESRAISAYRFCDRNREVQIQFVAKGESFLPTAVSSMVAKYVRELTMLIWNRYWSLHIPDIRPTKGYPQDAKRFKREIAVQQKKLGIKDEEIWRNV